MKKVLLISLFLGCVFAWPQAVNVTTGNIAGPTGNHTVTVPYQNAWMFIEADDSATTYTRLHGVYWRGSSSGRDYQQIPLKLNDEIIISCAASFRYIIGDYR